MTQIKKTNNSLTISRTFDVSRERVWRAITEPGEVERWFGPGSMAAEVHAFELEPGGAYSVSMLDDENRYDIDGEILEVVENERLAHTWEPGRVTVELRDVDGGCELVFTHEELPDRETTDGHASGWSSALDNLAEVL